MSLFDEFLQSFEVILYTIFSLFMIYFFHEIPILPQPPTVQREEEMTE